MTRLYNFRNNRYYLAAKITILAAFPLCLILAPKTYFDNNSQTICLFTLLTKIECYGCGLTRACMRLIHLEFKEAWNFNGISFIVLPILCYLLLQEFITSIKQFKKAYNT